MATQQPQPVRSSLLFSPVVSSNSPTSSSDSSQPNDLDSELNKNDNSSNSINSQQFQHHRRRSDFRSKSTDQIIPNPSFNSTNPVISSTTLYTSPPSGKFSNVNVSQPALRAAPIVPVPIPATRFDTITSYVDVIYQQQQQLQQQQQQGHSHANSRSQPSDSNQQSIDQDLESQNIDQSANGVVYLDPSDGIDGDQSFMATCPQCTMMVMTEISSFPGGKSKRMAFCLAPLLLCWLPYSSLKIGKRWMNVKHTCPKCQSTIAIYRK